MPEVVVPWRAQDSRMFMFDVVTGWLDRHFPDWPVHFTDVPVNPYNLAAARNLGVSMVPDDVVVVLDADTIVDPDVLAKAVDYVIDNGGIVIPYDRYWKLDQQGDEMLRAGTPIHQCHRVQHPDSVSGAAVTTREAWFEVGGQDEQFRGWGCEDNAWFYAASTLGHLTIMEGPAFAGWHEPQFKGRAQYRQNRNRLSKYEHANGNVRKMRALIRDQKRYEVSGVQAKPLMTLSS